MLPDCFFCRGILVGGVDSLLGNLNIVGTAVGFSLLTEPSLKHISSKWSLHIFDLLLRFGTLFSVKPVRASFFLNSVIHRRMAFSWDGHSCQEQFLLAGWVLLQDLIKHLIFPILHHDRFTNHDHCRQFKKTNKQLGYSFLSAWR